jgi:serine protease Do
MSPSTWGRLLACQVILTCLLWASPASTRGAEQVTVTLVGGAKITATLLRESDEGVVLDLGFDVLNIPAKKVLDVSRHDTKAEQDTTKSQGIFSTGRLEAAEVPELVKRFGDAVVMVKNATGRGSGFLISRQGHLITNYHVVEGHTEVQVTLFKRTSQGYQKHEFKHAKILALQPRRDIALLQVDLAELKGDAPAPVVIDDRNDLRVGDLIFAIGNPLGLERSVTQGIVSSTTRTIGHLRLIQTDASINPGNSGGPLFNARGEIVGIVCAGATSFDGLAFGIPATDLVDFLVHRDTWLYDSSQPMNGVTYLQPPYRDPEKKEANPKLTSRNSSTKQPPEKPSQSTAKKEAQP